MGALPDGVQVTETTGIDRAIEEIRTRLCAEFAASHARQRIDQVVDQCARGFDHSRITTYLPVLVEKAARDRLRRTTPAT